MCISRLKFCCEIQFFFHQSYEHTEGNNYNTEPFGTAIQLWSPLWYDIEICTINIWLLRNIRLNVICDKVVLTKIIAYQLVVDMVTMQPIDYYSEQAGAPKGVAFHKSVLNSRSCVDANSTHRSVAFVTESHRALWDIIIVRINFHTHAVSKGSGKLVKSSPPFWKTVR